MNKEQAEQVSRQLSELLSGKSLIAVAVHPSAWLKVEVRPGIRFKGAYLVDYQNGKYSVALSDSYGVMTGSDRWTFSDRGTVVAETTNAFGEALLFSWTVVEEEQHP